MRLFCLAISLSAAILAPPAWARDGASIYKSQCVACHGPAAQGQLALGAPPLTGQTADYLVQQLKGFRAGWRGAGDGPAATMRAVAQSLPDDASLRAVANYLSALRVNVPPAGKPADPGSLMAGKGLFGVCIGCHGNVGEGTPALAAPRINHLPPSYLEEQLRAYRDGRRGAQEADGAGRQMRQVALDALPDDDAVRQVAAYIVTLPSRTSR